MAATVSITISSDDPDELSRLLRLIAQALETSTDTPSPTTWAPGPLRFTTDSPSRVSAAAHWYRAHGEEFTQRIKPNAFRALAVIAREGPVVTFDRVAELLDKRGPELAGSLASVGAAARNLRAPLPPFSRDPHKRVYEMEPEIQRALLDATFEPWLAKAGLDWPRFLASDEGEVEHLRAVLVSSFAQ